MANGEFNTLFQMPPINWDPAPEIWRLFQDRFTNEDKIKLARAQIVASKAMMTAQLEYLNAMEAVVERYMK